MSVAASEPMCCVLAVNDFLDGNVAVVTAVHPPGPYPRIGEIACCPEILAFQGDIIGRSRDAYALPGLPAARQS